MRLFAKEVMPQFAQTEETPEPAGATAAGGA